MRAKIGIARGCGVGFRVRGLRARGCCRGWARDGRATVNAVTPTVGVLTVGVFEAAFRFAPLDKLVFQISEGLFTSTIAQSESLLKVSKASIPVSTIKSLSES